MREKEREFDNALRRKENQILFKNIDEKYILDVDYINEDLNKNSKELLQLGAEEIKPKTTFEIEDYNSSDKIININNENEKKPNINIGENNKINFLGGEVKMEEEKKQDIKNNSNDNKNVNNEINNKNNQNIVENEEIKIEDMTLEQLESGLPKQVKNEIILQIQNNFIPNNKEDLFKYKIDWNFIAKYELKRKKFKVYIEEKLLEFFDDVDAFTKFVLEKLGVLAPIELQKKVEYVLEENSEVSLIYNLIK
jgi:hypothetical protein